MTKTETAQDMNRFRETDMEGQTKRDRQMFEGAWFKIVNPYRLCAWGLRSRRRWRRKRRDSWQPFEQPWRRQARTSQSLPGRAQP